MGTSGAGPGVGGRPAPPWHEARFSLARKGPGPTGLPAALSQQYLAAPVSLRGLTGGAS